MGSDNVNVPFYVCSVRKQNFCLQNQPVLKVMFWCLTVRKKSQIKNVRNAQILTEMIPSFRLLQSINTQSVVIDDSQKSIHCLQTCAHVCHSLLYRQNEEAAAGIVSAETIIILATFNQPALDREHTSANPMHYPIMWPSSTAPALSPLWAAAVFLHCYSSTNRTPQPLHSWSEEAESPPRPPGCVRENKNLPENRVFFHSVLLASCCWNILLCSHSHTNKGTSRGETRSATERRNGCSQKTIETESRTIIRSHYKAQLENSISD